MAQEEGGGKSQFSKRQKFVVIVFLLSAGVFVSEFFTGTSTLLASLLLATLTDILLYWVLRKDIRGSSCIPIFILPFFYTLSCGLFYSVVPQRMISRVLITLFYSFGLYSLLLTQNIFAVSTLRTINLVRSARIVSFVLTLVILFFLTNTIFSLRLPYYATPFGVALIAFFLGFQSLWVRTLDGVSQKDVLIYALTCAFMLFELAWVLTLWPVEASIYTLFITGMFYTYIGVSQVWFEKRLFKGVLWEYIWVGFFSILFLVIFSGWGI